MDWTLDNLTWKQQCHVHKYGYVGAFYSVFMPRLLAAPPPKAEPTSPSPDTDVLSNDTYIPLAHRK